MNFWGIEIEKKTDILALTAFILSLIAAIVPVISWIRGPNIELIKPSSITLNTHTYPGDSTKYLSISVPFAYINTGTKDYSAIIEEELLQFHLNESMIDFNWLYFTHTNNDDKSLKFNNLEPASPVAIYAGQSHFHETVFYPRAIHNPELLTSDDSNFVKIEDFVSYILESTNNENPNFVNFPINVSISIRGDEDIKITLVCYIYNDDIIKLLNEKIGWTVVSCTNF